jgi:redox-sensitive bicupin YhaK (pirin superfamily)
VLEMPPEHEERAVYVVQGELAIDDARIAEGQLAALAPGGMIRLRAVGESRAMLLGGNRFPTPRHIWWNFVASSHERIESAKERWAKREFPPVPGETEFIPLPSE